jgi:N-acetylated-alpha-linked acidic dipeptidase
MQLIDLIIIPYPSYGATTFPGLTEAMTIDRDVKAAQREADELTYLIQKMSERLMVTQ